MNATINRGKAIHEVTVSVGANGELYTSVDCGAVRYRNAMQPALYVTGDKVTCKKCEARIAERAAKIDLAHGEALLEDADRAFEIERAAASADDDLTSPEEIAAASGHNALCIAVAAENLELSGFAPQRALRRAPEALDEGDCTCRCADFEDTPAPAPDDACADGDDDCPLPTPESWGSCGADLGPRGRCVALYGHTGDHVPGVQAIAERCTIAQGPRAGESGTVTIRRGWGPAALIGVQVDGETTPCLLIGDDMVREQDAAPAPTSSGAVWLSPLDYQVQAFLDEHGHRRFSETLEILHSEALEIDAQIELSKKEGPAPTPDQTTPLGPDVKKGDTVISPAGRRGRALADAKVIRIEGELYVHIEFRDLDAAYASRRSGSAARSRPTRDTASGGMFYEVAMPLTPGQIESMTQRIVYLDDSGERVVEYAPDWKATQARLCELIGQGREIVRTRPVVPPR